MKNKKNTTLTDKSIVFRNDSMPMRYVKGVLYVFDENSMQLNTYNELGSLIWYFSKPPTSIEKLIKKITLKYDVSYQEAKKDVYEFVLSEIGDNGILLLDKHQ